MLNATFKQYFLDAIKLFAGITGVLFFLANPQSAAQSIMQGLALCYKSIIPALFPFFIFSKLIMHSKFAYLFGFVLYPYTRFILKIKSKKAQTALVLGLTGGFGTGADCLKMLYLNKEISKKEAYILLCCIVNAGPAFVVGSVGSAMLSNVYTGWLLYITLCVSSLITGAVAATIFNSKKASVFFNREQNNTYNKHDKINTKSFVTCVQDAVYITLTLCGFVLTFSFYLAAIMSLNLPKELNVLLAVILEVTVACNHLVQTNNVHVIYYCCVALSLMGLSIMLQIKSILNGCVSIMPLVVSRIVHLPISILLLFLLIKTFNVPLQVFAQNTYIVKMPIDAIFAVVFFCCAFFCALHNNTSKT